jgi:DoxX-like family
MVIACVAITLVNAAFNTYAAYLDFTRAEWIVTNMNRYGVPRSWLFSLGALKAAGAVGLLIGFAAPPIGVAASVGLVVYFIGAVVTVVRARWYSHLRYPAPFLVLAVSSLVLRLAP